MKYLGVLDLEGICWTSTNTTGAGILEMSSVAVNSMGKLFAIVRVIIKISKRGCLTVFRLIIKVQLLCTLIISG